jgi:glycosyltransferase involved in cell wall biosynthesis
MKIILFANTDWYLYNFRLGLVEGIRKQGHQVVLISPPGPYSKKLQDMGYKWIPVDLTRRGMNPFSEIRAINQLRKIIKRELPDIINNFTIKCVLYGSLAVKGIKAVHTVNSVTGLGFIFYSKNILMKILRPILFLFLGSAIKDTALIFQNEDDRDLFAGKGMIGSSPVFLIQGSGVDTKKFTPRPNKNLQPIVLLSARLLWSKGIKIYLNAARHFAQRGTKVRFAIVGRLDPGNPESLTEMDLDKIRGESIVDLWGWREDMQNVYTQADIVCLPSFGEGLPRSLMEAAACGRPLVATDVPGCRELVNNGSNGYLFIPDDLDDLVKKINILITDPKLRQRMGENGRTLVETQFSSDVIVNKTLQVYNQISGVGNKR